MFTKITLNNFRSFDHIEFDLTTTNNSPKHLALVYGENGIGKSNLMSSFVLLDELLNTLNVRDVYEEMIKQKAIFADEKYEQFLRKHLSANLRDMQAIIDDCRMIGNFAPISAEYEFLIGNNLGKYYIELGDNEILHERLEFVLTKRRGTYFDCKKDSIVINSNIINDKDFLSDIKASAKRFWGKHSLLAIICYEIYDKSSSFGFENISENFHDVLTEFTMISCSLGMGSRHWSQLISPLQILESPIKGNISKENEKQLDFAEKIFSHLFSSINPNIKKVYYDKSYNGSIIDYYLYFTKHIAQQDRNIPFSKESTGTHQLLKTFCYILCACMGGIVIIDEADAGIHDVLFKQLILEVQPFLEGQLILTVHNTLLMEADFARDTVYILDEDEYDSKKIQSISSYSKRTYQNNNIRNKYLNNEYGGIPENVLNLSSIIDNLDKHLKNNLYS